MFSSLQLPFLQALGYAIANSLWQLFLLWLIVVLINSFVKQSAHVRYVTAVSAQVAGFVWFVSTFQFYYRHCQEASLQAAQFLANNDVVYSTGFAMNDNVLNYLIKAEETLPYLSVAYLFLLVILLIKWINNFRYTKQISSIGLQPANTSWQRFVSETADRLGILQDVTLYISEIAKSPLTIGYIKPIILLPLASINQLTTEQMEAVLLHELAHIKRADYLINILISVVEIILFFNPFTRLLSQAIKKERENCCDDWVLQYQYDAAMYAEALLRLAYLQKQNGFQMNAVANKKGELLQRVKRMIQPQKTFNYKHQIIALFLITGLLFSLAWLQPVEKNFSHKPNTNVKEINKKIVITPLTAQVENPLFSAVTLLAPSLQKDVQQSLNDINKTINDSIVNIGIVQARQAIQQVAPAVITTVSSANWQKMMQDAKEEASKSLKEIDWKNIQSDIPQMIDSAALIQSVNDALQNKTDEAENAKQGLAAATEQLEKLKNQKSDVYFDKQFLQQITTNAFSALKNINFKAIEDSIKISANTAAGKMFLQLKAKQDEIKKRQRLEFKKAQDNYKKAEDVLKLQAPAAPPLPKFPAEEDNAYDAIATSTSNVNGDNNYALFSVPVYHIVSENSNSQKTIRIINKSDSSTINIVIEIRQ